MAPNKVTPIWPDRHRPAEPPPKYSKHEWTRGETVALALDACTTCNGIGFTLGRRGGTSPCNCVLRTIFRICFKRFSYCAHMEKRLSRVRLDLGSGKNPVYMWGRKEEEYCADFYLIARRTLTPFEFQLFALHFLCGFEWKQCCEKSGLDRGNFFHAVYRIEQKLGRAFRETKPYALFPLDEYFGGAARGLKSYRGLNLAATDEGKQADAAAIAA